MKGYTGGQWTLVATRRGLLRIDTGRLTEANAHGGISVFTLFTGQPVETGETVAKAKVTPLAIAEPTIRAIEAVGRGVVGVTGFRPTTIGAVANERLEPKQRTRFESALLTVSQDRAIRRGRRREHSDALPLDDLSEL